MPVVQRTDLFLSMARSLRSWQLFALFLAVGNIVLVGSFARLALTTRLVPYLVEVDRAGEPHYAGPIEATSLPEERLLVAQLRQFVWELRVVVNDPPAQAELVAQAYALASPELRRKLDRYFASPDNDPRQIAPHASRAIDAITLIRLPGSENTFQAEWREIEADRTGLGLARQRFFHGLITVSTVRIEDPQVLARNPLGLLVTDFNWTETTLSETPRPQPKGAKPSTLAPTPTHP